MINNFITLDGKKYKTSANNWLEIENSPRQHKRLLSSAGDISFGVNTFLAWKGDIFVDVSPTDILYGSFDDLQTTFRKKSSLTMIDHYGVSRSVVMGGTMEKRSILPDWADPSNEFHISVEITSL